MAEITSAAFIAALKSVGILPAAAETVFIRAGVAGGEDFVRIMYAEPKPGEPEVTTRRMNDADARGIEQLTAAQLLAD